MEIRNTNSFFHLLANTGKDIQEFRKYHRKLSKLPAKNIEAMIQLAKLKQYFLNKKK